MNKLFRNIICLCLALLTLGSALGLPLNKMVCLSSGNIKVSITELKDCCPEEEESSFPVESALEDRCCDFSSQLLQIDFTSDLNHFKLKLSNLFFAFVHFDLRTFYCFKSISVSQYLSGDLPPPLSGYRLLKLISVFRI